MTCIVGKLLALSSCANILPPTGGPRDSLPPKLVMSLPKDSAIHVTSKNITLTFDEYIVLDNPLQNVIISPAPSFQGTPAITGKLKTVNIKLKDSLEPNTTYSINFGNGIKDVNEGNIAKGLIYVFSTGATIDYNTYRGKVINAETGKTDDSTLVVVLHRNLADSAISKLGPRYYARLNGKGEFIFHNLPQGNFNVFVVADAYSKKYIDSTKTFAFRNSPVIINAATPVDTLYAFKAFKTPEKSSTGTRPLSSQQPGKTLPVNKEDKRLKYMPSLENGTQDLLSDMTITFNRRLKNLDSAKIVLYDTNYNKLSGLSVSLDTGKTKVILQYPWKENFPLRLLIAKDAVSDSAGITLLKADTIRFYTKKETDYGSVRIGFSNLDLSRNPVLQVVQNNILLESIPLTQREFRRKRFRPGAYELRILYDANKNGVWDTGKFLGGNKRQPEIVYLIPKQLAIRGNWDNEVTITL